ncbi:hypothetical protein [Erwinia sp. 9145]|uniref:hypothetical protein n=1 Tax=Erwinia sp. 9145 TaxID=1500895 RepID=UPI00054DAA3E|nr:hypothetical protein [Erwinia sp. 9145]
MNSKSIGTSLVSASVILGVAIFFSAMVKSGLILQKEKVQPKENILTTTVGHVNLGKVYSESRGMNITLHDASEKSAAALDLTNVDPNNFSKELHDALFKIAREVNESQGLTGEKALKPESLSGKVPFELTVKTYMNYRSENMPMYTLMIKNENFIVDKNEVFESRITNEAERIAKESAPEFAAASFINAPM